MGVFHHPGWQPLSDAGAILANGTLTFSATGTSTAKNIYSDKALTQALSNPYSLDSAGRVADTIFMLEDAAYRVVLKNSAGTTIWTEDNIWARAIAYDEVTRRRGVARSPIDNGAVGDGSTDDATALQAAITAAGVGTVDLEGKTYRCDSALSIPSGLTLRNGTIDFSACNADEFILAQGSSGSAVNVSANIAEQDSSFTAASIAGIAGNDLLHLYASSGATAGEIVRVESAAGSTITLSGRTQDAYTTANTAQYKEITPHVGITLEDLVIIGNTAASGSGNAIVLDRCYGARLRNVQIRTVKGDCLTLKLCCETTIDGCSFRQATYGVVVRDASIDTAVANCSFFRLSGGVHVGANSSAGVTYRTRVTACSMQGTAQGLILKALSRNTAVDDCEIQGDTYGVYIEGRDVTVGGCNIFDQINPIYINAQATDLAIADYTQPRRLKIVGNTLRTRSNHCIRSFFGDGYDYEQIDISGNTLYGFGLHVTLDADTATAIRSLTLSGNNMDDAGSASAIFLYITVAGAGATFTIDRVVVSGNTKEGGGAFIDIDPGTNLALSSIIVTGNSADGAILLESNGTDYDRVVVSDNVIEVASGTYGIRVQEANDVIVADNTLTAVTTDGIYVATSSALARVAITGNSVSGVTGTNAIGIFVGDYNSVAVTGNVVGASGGGIDFGIRVSSLGLDTDCITVSGNSITGIADTSGNAGISIVGDSGQRASNISIVGNTYLGPRHGILIDSYADNIAIGANVIELSTTNAAGIYVNGAAASAIDSVSVSGNVVDASAATAPLIHINGYVTNCTVSDNTLTNGSIGVSVSAAAADTINRAIVANNTINNSDIGISVTSSKDVSVAGNISTDANTGGIYVDECSTFHVVGNRVMASADYGIQVDNTTQEFTQGAINGNVVRATGIALEVDASDATGSYDLSISGNSLISTGNNSIEITGIITGITITGNACQSSDAVPNIDIAGDAAGNITQCTVTGNALKEGTYGINVANNATTYHAANTFESMATGNTNGTFAAMIYST